MKLIIYLTHKKVFHDHAPKSPVIFSQKITSQMGEGGGHRTNCSQNPKEGGSSPNSPNSKYATDDIKHVSDGSRLEAPTIPNGIESTLVRPSRPTHNVPSTLWPRPRRPDKLNIKCDSFNIQLIQTDAFSFRSTTRETHLISFFIIFII